MARNYKFVSSKRVMAKVIRDYGFTNVSEDDLIEWVGEVLSAINVHSIKKSEVALIEVENHQATIPTDIEELVQVFKYTGEKVTEPTVISDDKPLKYESPYEERYEYLDDFHVEITPRTFEPIRLANHTLFPGILCDTINKNLHSCVHEYQLFNDTIKTSFPEGIIAIAYRTTVLDEEGFPMVPESTTFLNALASYAIYRVTSRYWYQGREGYGDKMQKAEQDYQFYARQASNEAFLPYGLDDHQDMAEASKKMIKTLNDYYNGFKNKGNQGSINYKKGIR